MGGIASVVSTYARAGLFERFPSRALSTHGGASLWERLAFTVRALPVFFFALLCRDVALVHAHVASRGSFKRKSLFLALARAFGVPTIFHLHGAQFHKFADSEAGPALRRWIVYSLERSSRVIVLSEAWAAYVRKLAPRAKVEVIANPVAFPEELDQSAVEPGRVLFLGRVDQRKGAFDLLEAARIVAPQVPGFRLALGGDGDLGRVRETVRGLGLAGQVEVLGWVGPESKEQEFARAQIFVLPSYDEGLPMAMLEAMALGKAIVVTPVGGIPEAVQDGEQGLLVPPGDPAALAATLTRLLNAPDLCSKLGVAARARVAERFSTDIVLKQVVALYGNLGVHSHQGGGAAT